MAHLQSTSSGGVTRRDYSTPLPFVYTKQPSQLPLADPILVDGRERQRHALPSSAALPSARGQTLEDWVLPKDQMHGRWQEPELEKSLQGHLSTTTPTKRTNLDFSRSNLKRLVPRVSQPSETGLRQVFRDGAMHQMKREGDVAYEHVDGVCMDTHPASSTNDYSSDEPIPMIEARDINEIRPLAEHTYTANRDSQEEQMLRAHSLQSSSSDSDTYPARQWSGTTDSTSATSTSSVSAGQTEALTTSPASPEAHNGQRARGQSPTDAGIPPAEAASRYAHLEDDRSAASGLGRKMELDVIKEEDGESISSLHNLAAAPSPAVKGVKDTDRVATRSLLHLLPSVAKAAKAPEPNSAAVGETGHGGKQTPTRVLVAPGMGDDRHIYELEATHINRDVSDPSSPSRNGTIDESVTGSLSSESSGGTGLAGVLHHKISNAAHAIEDKVKKSVSFSPVDDVRFLTPSPSRLGEGGRHEDNKIQRNKLR